MNPIKDIKEKQPIKTAVKEKVTAAPKELARRGTAKATHSIKEQIQEAAQTGSSTNETPADQVVRAGEQLVQRTAHDAKKVIQKATDKQPKTKEPPHNREPEYRYWEETKRPDYAGSTAQRASSRKTQRYSREPVEEAPHIRQKPSMAQQAARKDATRKETTRKRRIELDKGSTIKDKANVQRDVVPKTHSRQDIRQSSVQPTSKRTGIRQPKRPVDRSTQKPVAHIKTAERTVRAKSSSQTIKAADKTVRQTNTTIKTAGNAAARAKAASQPIRQKVTAAVREKTVKAGGAALRALARSAKALLAALGAGGSVAALVLVVLVLVGMLVASPFGLFFGDPDAEGMTLRQVITEINQEYADRISGIIDSTTHDDMRQEGSRAPWKEVLAVYAVKLTTDPDNPLDVATMDAERAELLREIYWTMTTIDSHTETYTEEETVLVPDETSDAEEDAVVEETQTVERTRLVITVTKKTAEEMAAEYGFNEEQLALLSELLSDQYDTLWFDLSIGGGCDDIVEVALSQLGNVGGEPYWSWYGFNSHVSWCACFVSWCGATCS